MKEVGNYGKKDMKVLVIEDSMTQGEMLRYILEDEGFKVHLVVSAEEALDFLGGEIPGLVISDVFLPGMTGNDLCLRVKGDSRWKRVPVILLTNLSETRDFLKGLESGADSFITKPYTRDYLLTRIENLLANRRLRGGPGEKDPGKGMEVYYDGEKHLIAAGKEQILDLLLSTFEIIIQKNLELEGLNSELKIAREKIQTLKGA